MKKKYIITLVIIGCMFIISLIISTSYGLWISTRKEEKLQSETLNCFKIYFSNGDTIEKTNIKPLVDEDGKETSPMTITVTNICANTKELQLRLNITKKNTINTDGLTIMASGNIEQDVINYNNLTSTKTTDKEIKTSKLIGLVKVNPNETVRTNIKLWFNEKKMPNIKPEEYFNAKFELIDTESSIKPTFSETILSYDRPADDKKNPNFAIVATLDEGLNKTEDNDGEVFYYRGNVQNNYVSFADNLWRIVRINGDKTVRLVLDETIGIAAYSKNNTAIDYTGLKYIYNNEPINNDISNYLQEWYNNNITSKGLDKFVATSSLCNDSSTTIQNYHTYFGSYQRLTAAKTPSLICPSTNNDFGGNYKEKIGLLSADEVALAGGVNGVPNYNYYLYTGYNYFTMSPAEYYNYRAYIYYVTADGQLLETPTNQSYSVRPVMNIESTVSVSGQGTKENPYTIDTK